MGARQTPVLPSVRAALAERFIINFRMRPEALAGFLPVPWLRPQPINGYGVVSFCILDLRGITVAPLPTLAGLRSISCAPRYAVLDASKEGAPPAVFVTERHTNSEFGAWFTTLGFSAPHPHVNAAIEHREDGTALRVSDPEQGDLFSASVRPTQALDSELLASKEAFAEFIAEGVSSYGRSRYEGRLTKLDLYKEDADYEVLAVDDVGGPLVERWQEAGAVLDSAFRTSGGRYEWAYHGLTEKEAEERFESSSP